MASLGKRSPSSPPGGPLGAPTALEGRPHAEASSVAVGSELEEKKLYSDCQVLLEASSPPTEAEEHAVLAAASAEELAAAVELEAAAAAAVASWPRPGPLRFELHAEAGRARAAVLHLPHGRVDTPVFMPVGTNGALKGVHIGLLESIDRERRCLRAGGPPSPRPEGGGALPPRDGACKAEREESLPKPPRWFSQLILSNTFHLYRQVGGPRMREVARGLHRFMRWGANLLTDSGGFQMVSLCRLMDVFEEGVCFRIGKEGLKKQKKKQQQSEVKKAEKNKQTDDGDAEAAEEELVLLTPEESIFMQNQIGSDIIMQLDDVIASTTPDPHRVEDAMLRSTRQVD
ncbi:hypothetical protein Efla_004686 [Eimeria flavescens]